MSSSTLNRIFSNSCYLHIDVEHLSAFNSSVIPFRSIGRVRLKVRFFAEKIVGAKKQKQKSRQVLNLSTKLTKKTRQFGPVPEAIKKP